MRKKKVFWKSHWKIQKHGKQSRKLEDEPREKRGFESAASRVSEATGRRIQAKKTTNKDQFK